eukprot:2688145-Pleurochrysis_carterae.AAC.3
MRRLRRPKRAPSAGARQRQGRGPRAAGAAKQHPATRRLQHLCNAICLSSVEAEMEGCTENASGTSGGARAGLLRYDITFRRGTRCSVPSVL